MSVERPPALHPSPNEPRLLPKFMLRSFWDELARRGISMRALETACGVTAPRRGDFSSLVSEQEVHRVFAAARNLTNDDALGLSVGRAIGAAGFHLLGHIALASATLEQASELVARAQPQLRTRMPELRALPGDRLGFGFFDRQRYAGQGGELEAQLTGVLLHEVVLWFLKREQGVPSVHFPFAAPRDPAPYRNTFAGRVEFDAEGTFIAFAESALQRRRSGADPTLLQQLFALAQEQYGGAQPEAAWSVRVRSALRAHAAPRLLPVDTLAEQFGVSTRALSRGLAREGSSFSTLLDEVLYERARLLLRRPGATSATVASALGYAEQSSFFRAFRRWSGGATPSAYRRGAPP